MTFSAPVPAWGLDTCSAVGGNSASPSSQWCVTSSASRGSRRCRALSAAVLDRVANLAATGRLGQQAVINGDAPVLQPTILDHPGERWMLPLGFRGRAARHRYARR